MPVVDFILKVLTSFAMLYLALGAFSAICIIIGILGGITKDEKR